MAENNPDGFLEKSTGIQIEETANDETGNVTVASKNAALNHSRDLECNGLTTESKFSENDLEENIETTSSENKEEHIDSSIEDSTEQLDTTTNDESQEMEMHSKKVAEQLEIAGLGRPFEIGMLYDCHSDQLIPNVSLFEKHEIEGNLTCTAQRDVKYDIFPSDSFASRFKALEVNDQLKLSILTGLLQVFGSAKFLDEENSFSSHKNVTLHRKSISKEECLSSDFIQNWKCDDFESLHSAGATHVVTKIVYGSNAFIVFDPAGNHQIAQTKELVKLFADKKQTNSTPERLPKRHKKIAEAVKVRFYSDVQPPNIPTNYSEAKELFTEFSMLNKIEDDMPVKVCLYPLDSFGMAPTNALCDVNIETVNSVQSILHNLQELEDKCINLVAVSRHLQLPVLDEQIRSFHEMISIHKDQIQKELPLLLVKVRNGEAPEDELANFMTKYEDTPFNSADLFLWLRQHQSEVSILKKFLGSMKGINIFTNSEELQSVCQKNLKQKYMLCMNIERFSPELYLEDMKTYLETSDNNENNCFSNVSLEKTANKSLVNCGKIFTDLFSSKSEISADFAVQEVPIESGEISTYISLYEDGKLINENYIPPSSPGPPTIKDISHDSVLLTWKKPEMGEQSISQYVLCCNEFKHKGADGIQQYFNVDANSEMYVVENLKPGTHYQFQLRVVSLLGPGPFSKSSKVISTLPMSPPGKPEVSKMTAFKAEIHWSRSKVIKKTLRATAYVILARNNTDNNWVEVKKHLGDDIKAEVPIKPNITYKFRVIAECVGVGRSLPSPDSEDFQITLKSDELIKANFRYYGKLVRYGTPSVYLLPVKEVYGHHTGNIRKCEVGHRKNKGVEEKVIMVVGATGSGKTTLINGIVNYILNVEWDDEFRFKLIDEPPKSTYANQARSQTSSITSYTIHHQEGFKVPYTLTIVDTPGFGDTEGIMRDKRITEQIRTFFSSTGPGGIDHIDAVGFVVQSSLARLTPTQRYIFDSILALFGKDIGANIFMLLTFADAQPPPVIDGIMAAQLPFKKFFKFNNSALYAANKDTVKKNVKGASNYDSDDDDDDQDGGKEFDRMFWEMGSKSFRLFLNNHLSKVETKTLVLTKDVLQERHILEVSVQGIQFDIQSGLNKLEQLEKEVAVLRAHRADIDKNKDFNYTVNEEIVELAQIQAGSYTTNCLTCKRTCHYPCMIKDDGDKAGCAAMRNGSCTVCPAQCVWNVHKNLPHKYEIKRVTVTKTAADLKARYEVACQEKLSAEQLIGRVLDDFEGIQIKVIGLTNDVRNSIERLHEIALKPNPLSTTEYIDLLIDTEKDEAQPGWEERVRQLRQVRREAEYMKQVAQDGYDPFEKYKTRIAQAKKKEGSIWSTVEQYINPMKWRWLKGK